MFTLLFALIGLCLFYNYYWKRRNLPPGPPPLPFLGNIISILRNPPGEILFRKWRDTYGRVYTFWLGNQPVVCVADYNLIMETFQKDGETFAARGIEREYMEMVRGSVSGVLFTDGEIWRDQRRFSLHVLRDFGLGKNLMQERVLDEIAALNQRIIKATEANPDAVPIASFVDMSVGSIINSLMFGYRYTDDLVDEFEDLKQRAQRFVALNGHPVQRLIRDWPQLYKNLPYFSSKLNEAKISVEYLMDFFRVRIEEHRKEIKELNLEDATPTDFVMAFLQEWQRREAVGESHFFSDEQLEVLLFDLWVAGQETTSNTIGWGVAALVHNPEVQKKAREELDRVVGSDRLVNVGDKNDLPYINAVINETQRIANLLPINLIHRVTKDVRVGDYDIKKDTWIVPQISVILSDPAIFPKPERFDPERFLENGKPKKVDELVPFSIGKRQCLGEGLARMELFLFLANILNQFELYPSAGKPPSMRRRFGTTVRCEEFKVGCRRRFQ